MEEQLRSLMADASLSQYAEGILRAARHSVRVECEPAREADFSKGQSKIGGLPDLPPGIEWPTWAPPVASKKPGLFARLFSKPAPQPEERAPAAHAFIAQFNLAEVAPHDVEKTLPGQGMLYFFFDAEACPWGFRPSDRGGWKVIYWNGDASQLLSTTEPRNLGRQYVYDPVRPVFRAEKTLPSWESPLLEQLGMSEDEIEDYTELVCGQSEDGDGPVSRLLGYPDAIQSNDMETQCQLVSNGIGRGGSVLPADASRVDDLLKGASDWKLLFQMDSQHLNTNWGDAGRIYYWTKSFDLARHNLDDTWLVLQCY